MTHEEVDRAVPLVEALELLDRNDRVTADTAGVELRIVRVMVVVRTFPDAGRGQYEKAPEGHQGIGEFGVLKDRLVLMIVVDDEHPGDGESCEHAAHRLHPQGRLRNEDASIQTGQQHTR